MKTYTVFLNFIRPEDMETDTYLVKVTANNPKDAQTQAIQYIKSIYGPMGWKVFKLSKKVYPDFDYENPLYRGIGRPFRNPIYSGLPTPRILILKSIKPCLILKTLPLP